MVAKNYYRMLLHTLVKIVAMKDPYTAGHQYRVADLAYRMAEMMALSSREREGLRWAALVHDVGKINVPAEILSKPGRLSPFEVQLIQFHVETGYNILKDIPFPWPLAQIVLEHHERMDGSGYPVGLHGSQISMSAKILAVADTVESMASHRPYRPAMGIEKALEEIEVNRWILYEPAAVDACLRLFRQQRYRFHEVNWHSLTAGLCPAGNGCYEHNQELKSFHGSL